MTMLLIMEAIDFGKIKLTDSVPTSEFAASMGGSQVFLEEGETQTAADMTKCIAIASANDAAVALAEAVCGSEEAFVEKMNQKARSTRFGLWYCSYYRYRSDKGFYGAYLSRRNPCS